MTNPRIIGNSLLAMLAVLGSAVASAQGPAIDWVRKLSTPAFESATAVSTDGLGSIYVSGTTRGVLGQSSAGGSDAYLAKYTASGDLTWIRQFGTSSDER